MGANRAVEQDDLYKVLGLRRECSPKELKSAFRTLARKYHPDVNPGDRIAEERFKTINLAYQTLIDPYERRAYDFAHPHAGRSGGAPPPQPAPPPTADHEPKQSGSVDPDPRRRTSSKARRVVLSIIGAAATIVLALMINSQILVLRDNPDTNPSKWGVPTDQDEERANLEILLVVGCGAAYLLHLVLERTMDQRSDDD